MHDRKNSRFICLTSKQMIVHFSSGHRISHMPCDRGLFTFWTCIHRNLARLKTTLAGKRTLPDHLVDYLGQPARQILEYVSDKGFWKKGQNCDPLSKSTRGCYLRVTQIKPTIF